MFGIFGRAVAGKPVANLKLKHSSSTWLFIWSHKNLTNSGGSNNMQNVGQSATVDSPDSKVKSPPTPPPQGLCCMSGCQNCVWLQYVDEMMEYYKDNTEQAKIALDNIPDESLKTFIKIELGL